MTTSRKIRSRLAFGAFLAGCLLLESCINLVPFPHLLDETGEAKGLATVLRRLAPETKDILLRERDVANQIDITLQETANADPAGFRQRLRRFQDDLVQIRDRRRNVLEAIRQGGYQSPLVFAVQQDTLRQLSDEILRTETFLQFARNVQIRADLGETKSFPEVQTLGKQLEGFLSQALTDPLVGEIRTLQEEFRFAEGP